MKGILRVMAKVAKYVGSLAVGLLTAGAAEFLSNSEQPQGYALKKTTTKKRTDVAGILSGLVGMLGSAPGAPRGSYATGSSGDIGGRLISDLMRDFGFTQAQAAGIAGNLAHESAGFQTMQEISPTVAGSRGGFGYAQWTGPRRREFEAWVKKNNLDIKSYAANYGFLKHELTNTWEKKAVAEVKQARTPAEAAEIFSGSFLRPGVVHLDSRVSWANKLFGGV